MSNNSVSSRKLLNSNNPYKSNENRLKQLEKKFSAKYNGNNINNTWIKLFLKDQNYSKYQIISASVKLSNVCNFRCAMCNPYDSSKIFDLWKSQKEESFVKQLTNNDGDYFEKITSTHYQLCGRN